MRCQAHQFNLYLKDILKCEAWATTMHHACTAASALIASSNKWLARLQDIIVGMYGRTLAVVVVADTRWNSIQMCLASQLRVRAACKRLANDYMSDPQFPSACTIYVDPTFWIDVEAAELASRPLVEASFVKQNDATTLADVVNALGHVYRNSVTSAKVLAALEKRWQAEEHPLVLLAYLFHPKTADALSIVPFALLNANDLADTAVFYFKKFFPQNSSDGLLMLVVDFIDKDDALGLPLDPLVVGDWVQYWRYLGQRLPQLAQLAMRILSVVCQSASCERLFKDFAMIHTKARNRMSKTTTVAITRVKHELVAKKKTAATKPPEKTKKRIIHPQERRRLDLAPVVEAAAARVKGIRDEVDSMDLTKPNTGGLETSTDAVEFWQEILGLFEDNEMSDIVEADLVEFQNPEAPRPRPSFALTQSPP
ncbi:hypothetical protein ACHHYP_11709 [Achlya hypogyna]|uniref:HAT C-terminal dimerisation domain-containing protein n=1 Tax=Achlya hypogyna TaxID=1202772 RepID=A0A1V9YIN9_ACHHY|nr:hypothetical protein ACHHYP_11709 [Achlya hypogyna]